MRFHGVVGPPSTLLMMWWRFFRTRCLRLPIVGLASVLQGDERVVAVEAQVDPKVVPFLDDDATRLLATKAWSHVLRPEFSHISSPSSWRPP